MFYIWIIIINQVNFDQIKIFTSHFIFSFCLWLHESYRQGKPFIIFHFCTICVSLSLVYILHKSKLYCLWSLISNLYLFTNLNLSIPRITFTKRKPRSYLWVWFQNANFQSRIVYFRLAMELPLSSSRTSSPILPVLSTKNTSQTRSPTGAAPRSSSASWPSSLSGLILLFSFKWVQASGGLK